MRIRMSAALFVAALLASSLAAPLGFSGKAFAVADSHASCEGLGVSAAAPGQNLEFVHEAAGIVAFFAHERKADAEILGTTPGAITSADAQQHLGSPEACFSE